LKIGEGGTKADGGEVAEKDTVEARARVLDGWATADGMAASIDPLPVLVTVGTGAVAAD
jgi:hypothetical protein